MPRPGRQEHTDVQTSLRMKEQDLLRRQLSLVKGWSWNVAVDYVLLMQALMKTLRYQPRFTDGKSTIDRYLSGTTMDRENWVRFDFVGNTEQVVDKWDRLLRSNSMDLDYIVPWVRWLILHVGPDAFFKQ
jgi:hypothetical protein